MSFTYYPKGVCSQKIQIELAEDHTIQDIRITGGCDGNLKGVRALCIGQKACLLYTSVFFSLFVLMCFATKSTENEELADSTRADNVDMLAESSNVSTTAIKSSGTIAVSVSISVMMFTLGSNASGPRMTRPIAPQK